MIFQAAGFRCTEKGCLITPQTHLLSQKPLKKVSTHRRVRICSQLGHERGNCHCKSAGLSPAVDIGKGQEGRVRVRVNRALWAMGLEVESQNVG